MAKKTDEQTTDVAVVEQEAVVVPAAPAFQVETCSTDMILPFLKVIQSQADEVTPGKDKYNENVRPGNIYDSVTRTIYKNPEIIVCGIKKYYGEWEGDVRGKLIAKHRVDSETVKNAVKKPRTTAKGNTFYDLETADGHQLIETFGIVCIVKHEGISIPATFTLSKSAFAVGKTLNTLLTMYQAQGVPIFKFATNTKTNDKGSWFVPVFDLAGFETDTTIINLAASMAAVVEDIIFSFAQGEIDPPADNDVV